MRREGMHYFSPTKKTSKSPCSVQDTPKNTVPVIWHITKKSGRIKLPNGQKRGKIVKVFYGLDTMQYRAIFPLTLGFTMDKIQLAEKADILTAGDRIAFLLFLS
jgi:hypothetical protein